MLRSKADRVLDQMVRENRRASAPLTPEQEAKRRDRRSDVTVAALGVTLGLICALFPWYIFFNPDQFGVRAMKFGGSGGGSEPIVLGAQPERFGAPIASDDIEPVELDLLSTGTVTKDDETDAQERGTPGIADQPFPAPAVAFRVIQIANGRAMIEDDTGLFVVQPGSLLPDSTRVRTIGERNGRPVVITEAGETLEIAE